MQFVPVYPVPDTVIANHPYAVLSWSDKAAAAADFYSFVRQQGGRIDGEGFRATPPDGGTAPAGQYLRTQPRGVAWVVPQAPNAIPAPDGAVIRQELVEWDRVRKPAHVLFLVGASIDRTSRTYLNAALADFSPQDQVGLAVFPGASGSAWTLAVPIGSMDSNHEGQLRSAIDNLGSGAGNLEPALLGALAAEQKGYDAGAVNAVVVVDSGPPSGSISQSLAAGLRNQSPDRFVRVFTLGPDSSLLKEVAVDGEGVYYPLKPGPNFLRDLIGNF